MIASAVQKLELSCLVNILANPPELSRSDFPKMEIPLHHPFKIGCSIRKTIDSPVPNEFQAVSTPRFHTAKHGAPVARAMS